MRRGGLGLLLALALAGCGEAADPVPDRPTATPEIAASARSGGRTVIDALGRSVALGDVEKVVALSPSTAEFAAALGLQVLGRSSDTAATIAPNAKVVGSSIAPDFAAVAALEPDLVLADATYHSGRTRDFDRFAYPVYVVTADTYLAVLDTLRTFGTAVGRDAEATAVIAGIEARAAAAKSRSGSPAPRVLILTGGGRDVFAGGPNTYLGSLVTELGGTVVSSNPTDGGPLPGFGVVAVGEAGSLRPDVVLVLSSGEGGLVARINEHPSWKAAPAVINGRVVDLDTTLYLRAPGPRAGEALEGLAGVLWP